MVTELFGGLNMKRMILLALGVSILVIATAATAGDMPRYAKGNGATIHGGSQTAAKAGRDTLLLMGPTGSGAAYVGDFESGAKAFGTPVNGWTSIDFTQPTTSHFQLSSYVGQGALGGAQWVWCGDITIPSCDGGATDPAGGYGNDWNDMLEWRQVVTNNAISTTLGITATANIYSEPGYDGTTLLAEKFDQGFVDINYWDGISAGLAISETVTYLPGEYMGAGSDEVVLVWNFQSDGGWSDEDCSFPTSGALQLDDVTITSDNGAGTGGVVDFESTLAPFAIRFPVGVGDFAKIWTNLEDADPCATNYSRQVAFIDDGLVVPGTGGTPCQDWCYGPNGFIVNTTGGLAGPASHLHSAVISPAMTWADPTHRGGVLTFDVYRHEDLSADAPGMFYTWNVRSTATGDPADLDAAGWENRNLVQFGGPDYLRQQEPVDDLLVTNPSHVQVRLAAYELGWVWGYIGNDGYPAPYFDHVRFETYPVIGPGLATREIDLANDAFPENGTIDMVDPGSLWVRFDQGQNISAPSHLRRDRGDSLAFDCVVTRQDAVLNGLPEIVYTVQTNPVFDPYRTDPTPYTGRADCGIVTGPAGLVVPDRFYADLPDTGWLFPGDIVHYYLEASDIDTLTSAVETATLPADLTDYGVFDDPLGYNPAFVVRCLPTISDLTGAQPAVMFWNDFGNRGGMNEWFTSFDQLGLVEGVKFDHYYTNAPSSGIGNGLGGAATSLQIANYDVLLYTSGDLSNNTMANGDFNNDSGEDVQVLTQWLNSGGKGAFVTGDDLAADLAQSGLDTSAFLANMLNVTFNDTDLRDLIGGQASPRVLATGSNPVFSTVSSWIAYGGCAVINVFDAVTVTGLGDRIAVFANPSGNAGGYPYSACTLATGVGTAGTSEVISMPHDFIYIYTDPNEGSKAAASLAARVRVLSDVLAHFGIQGESIEVSAADDTPSMRLTASNYPNPFNPVTTIKYVAPRNGEMSLKVYNVKGQLVRTLINGSVAQGENSIDWNGKDDRGSQVASGVYFYEVRMGNDVQVNKMALVK
jgi:hypothetical protein